MSVTCTCCKNYVFVEKYTALDGLTSLVELRIRSHDGIELAVTIDGNGANDIIRDLDKAFGSVNAHDALVKAVTMVGHGYRGMLDDKTERAIEEALTLVRASSSDVKNTEVTR